MLTLCADVGQVRAQAAPVSHLQVGERAPRCTNAAACGEKRLLDRLAVAARPAEVDEWHRAGEVAEERGS